MMSRISAEYFAIRNNKTKKFVMKLYFASAFISGLLVVGF